LILSLEVFNERSGTVIAVAIIGVLDRSPAAVRSPVGRLLAAAVARKGID